MMREIFRSKKFIILIIVILLYCIWHYMHRHSTGAVTQDPVLVDVQKVKQGNIPIEAKAVGTLVAAKSVQITTEVAGQIQKILAQDGTFVTLGTPLIQLDDT